MPNESESDFVFRAHNALIRSVPDPSVRNRVVWDSWDSSRGNHYRDRATSFFATEKYRHVPEICYFYEHSTTARDGSQHAYSFRELSDIAENQNKRADTDCYSAIASHHTSDLIKGPGREPVTVGYAGVYRMGMIGSSDPKWAIFADEFHRKDQAKLFDDRRRRSVEVLRFRDGRTPVLDPIATLGVDSPRLNLPVARYEGNIEGEVERYSFMTTASVGANSSYVPSLEKQKYGGELAGTTEGQGSAFGGSLSPQDLKQITDAFRAIPEIQWVQSQMQQAKPTADSQSADDLSIPGAQAPVAPYANAPAAPPQVPLAPQQPLVSPSMPVPQTYSQEDETVDKERYAALEAANESLAADNAELKERYSQLSDANKKIMSEFTRQREALASLEMRACDGDRTQVIADLCEQYKSTGVFERDELLEKCLYSRGSEMSNEDFASQMELLEGVAKKVAKNSPINMPMIPDGVTASQASEQERYSAVMDRYAEQRPEDDGLDYDQIERKMIEEGVLSAQR